MAHLDDFELAAFFENDADAALRVRVLDEMARCEECRRLVASLAQELRTPAAQADPLGRYAIRERVGSGAWGAVYRAFDPVLEREVAIKLLLLRDNGDDARVKLQREGRLLARSEHPNVLRLFDAIDVGSDVALVMEFVRDGTLEDWISTRPSPEAILQAFCAAGRGLEAAHRVGVVHGDFKPRNVLLDGERVLVADFGLGHFDATDPTDESDLGSLVRPTWGGTRRYLAPERLAGDPASASSDQFAFGVALQDALPAVPTHLRRPLGRMTQADPARRFPTMREAVDAVSSARPRHYGVLAVAALAVSALALAPLQRTPKPTRPPKARARVYDSDDPRRVALFEAVERLSARDYEGVLEVVRAEFELSAPQRSLEWARAANYAAKAHGQLGNLAEHERLSGLVADVAVEVGASGLAAEATVAMLSARLQRTYSPEVVTLLKKADAYSKRALEEPGDDLVDLRVAIEVELARAAVQTGGGEFDAGMKTLDEAIERARSELGPDAPVLGRLLEFRAKLRVHLGDRDGGRGDARATIDLYSRTKGDDAVELANPLRQLTVLASGDGDFELALQYAEKSVRVLEANQTEPGLGIGRALRMRGGMHAILRNFEDADADLERARAIFANADGAEVELSDTLLNLARLRGWQGRLDEALVLLDRGIVLAETAGRPDSVARAELERCRLFIDADAPTQAEAACDLAGSMFTELFGAEHPAKSELDGLRSRIGG